jgi:O-antigen ligase
VLGACLAVLLLLLVQTLLSSPQPRSASVSQTLRHTVLILAVTVGVLGLLASFSRAAWIAFACGAALSVAQTKVKGDQAPSRPHADKGTGPLEESARPAIGLSTWWIPLLAALAFALVYGDLAMSRLVHLDAPTEARSLNERQRDASLAWTIIQAHPWRGVGTGNYEAAARSLNPDAVVVHNVPLMVTAEWGIPGAMLWLFLAMVGLRRRSDARAAWLALLVISLFDLSLWPTTSWHGAILFGVLAAVIAASGSQRSVTAVSPDIGGESREDGNAYRI